MDFLYTIILSITAFFLSLVPTREFREGLISQPVSFYPMKSVSQTDKTVSRLIYRSLFKYNIYGELENDLVSNYEISSDGLVYKIKIKDNQYFIDGKKITADDVFYSSINSPSLQGIVIDRVDDLTVSYTLQNKYAPFLSLLTEGVIQNGALEKGNDLMPVSSGDFRVIKVKRSGPIIKEVVLYSTKYNIQKLVFRFYVSEEELQTAAKLEEIDAFISYDSLEIPNFEKYKFPILSNTYGLFFNSNNEKIISKDLRQKIAKSINVEELSLEYGVPAEGVISKDIYTNYKINFNKYDKKLSEDLKEQRFVIKVPNYKNNKKVVENIRANIEDKLNIDYDIELLEPDKFINDVIRTKDFEVIFFGIETSRDPDRYLNWHSSGKAPGYNFTNFTNAVADKALEDGRNETEFSKRKVHYDKFQEVFDENLPAIFLYHPFMNYYVSKRVTGITEKTTFDLTDRFNDYQNWLIN
ncbi:MAG: ABC transporter substrate-binding protein [Proteobacteria bacterium]|nr:ABC transporter substrate-binding protein [Pseudomonadota bacterium]